MLCRILYKSQLSVADVLDVTKHLSDESWKAFFYHLTRVKEVSEDSTELYVKEHGRESCLKHYMETSTFSWRDVANASYGSGEASVIEKLFNDIIIGIYIVCTLCLN